MPCCTGWEYRPTQPSCIQWVEAALALQQSVSQRRTHAACAGRPGSTYESTCQRAWLAPQDAAAVATHSTSQPEVPNTLSSVACMAPRPAHASQLGSTSDFARALLTAADWPYQSGGCCSWGRSRCYQPKQRPLCQAAGRALRAGWCRPGLLPSQRASACPPPGTGLLPGPRPGQAWVVSAVAHGVLSHLPRSAEAVQPASPA